jgi:hypothetical protein
MKTLTLVVALGTAGLATGARAQGGVPPDFDPVFGAVLVTGAVIDALIGAGGLAAGTGTLIEVGMKGNSKPWWITSLAFGGANTVLTGLWWYIASNNFWKAEFVAPLLAHLGVAILDVVAAIVGITHPQPIEAPVEPAVVGGVDAAGQPWTGFGVRLRAR